MRLEEEPRGTCSGKERHVPPRGSFLVLVHELHVDIRLLLGAVPPLLPDLFSVVQVGVHDERRYGGKG